MPDLPKITVAERRRRIAVRHCLAPRHRLTDVADAAEHLVGIHASDPASVYLGLLARTDGVSRDDIAHALYDDRSVLRILGMRRTMFVTPVANAGVITVGATLAIARNERRRLLTWLKQEDVAPDVERWLAEVENQTVQALDEMGTATAAQLTRRVPGLGVQIHVGEGKKWQGTIGVSTRMLFLLASEGRIVRGKPSGSWLSSLYSWAPMDRWVPGGLAPISRDEAQTGLAQLWLRAFGPGTDRDLEWWTGWTRTDTRRALSAAGAMQVDLDGTAGYALADDVAQTADPGPWVALLPALDSTTMGWADRDWYLGAHRPKLFDPNGNAGPTIWVDGRIVGGWAQRESSDIAYRLFDEVGREAAQAIDDEAGRISTWLVGSRVIPRFRTPTERELS